MIAEYKPERVTTVDDIHLVVYEEFSNRMWRFEVTEAHEIRDLVDREGLLDPIVSLIGDTIDVTNLFTK
jgi:hypothetical protein